MSYSLIRKCHRQMRLSIKCQIRQSMQTHNRKSYRTWEVWFGFYFIVTIRIDPKPNWVRSILVQKKNKNKIYTIFICSIFDDKPIGKKIFMRKLRKMNSWILDVLLKFHVKCWFLKHDFFFSLNAVNSVSHAPVSMSPNVITTSEKKKVFVTGSGNIEVTQVSQPISHPPNVAPNLTPNVTSNVSEKWHRRRRRRKQLCLKRKIDWISRNLPSYL